MELAALSPAPAPKKKIVRRPQADDEKPHVAWRNNDAGSFGGGGFFGRF